MLCFGFGSAWLAFLYVCAVIGGNPCQQPKKDCGAVTVSQPEEIIGPNFLWWWQGCQVLRTLMLQRLFSLPEFSVVIMHRIWKKDYIKLLDFFFFFFKGYGEAEVPQYSQRRGLSLVAHVPGHTGKGRSYCAGEVAIIFTVWSDVNPYYRSLAISQTYRLMSYQPIFLIKDSCPCDGRA